MRGHCFALSDGCNVNGEGSSQLTLHDERLLANRSAAVSHWPILSVGNAAQPGLPGCVVDLLFMPAGAFRAGALKEGF